LLIIPPTDLEELMGFLLPSRRRLCAVAQVRITRCVPSNADGAADSTTQEQIIAESSWNSCSVAFERRFVRSSHRLRPAFKRNGDPLHRLVASAQTQLTEQHNNCVASHPNNSESHTGHSDSLSITFAPFSPSERLNESIGCF